MSDDYIPRECDCGHSEHVGPCRRRHTYYVPQDAAAPGPDAVRAPTHQRARNAGLQAWLAPCRCDVFTEYEGEQP